MTYNTGTDSYQNDFLEPIDETEFLCGVPYKIDREKYKEILERNHRHMRIHDANVVTFSYDYCAHDDGQIWLYNLFAWPKNSPKGSDDFYDCFQFDDDTEHKYAAYVEYHNFVRELMGCVVGVDVPTAINLRDEKVKELKRTFKELDELDNIIFSAK